MPTWVRLLLNLDESANLYILNLVQGKGGYW